VAKREDTTPPRQRAVAHHFGIRAGQDKRQRNHYRPDGVMSSCVSPVTPNARQTAAMVYGKPVPARGRP